LNLFFVKIEVKIRIIDREIIIDKPENTSYTEPMSGYYPATYFFISTVVFLFTGNFRVFARLGWMPSNWFTENGYIIGIAFGVWLLS